MCANSFVCLIAVRIQRYQWAEAVRAAQEEELAPLDLGNLLSLDPDHRIVHWSEGCRRLYGFGPEEVRGRLTHELLQTRVAQPLEQIHAALLDSGHWEGRVTRRRKDGSEVVVAILWALRRDAQGRPTAILEVSTDITEQESAGRAIRRQAALIDLSPDATIVRRLDGTITFWSRGAEAIYGWAKDQAFGRSTHALFGTRYPEPLEQIHDQLKRTGRWSGELIHWTKDGRDVVVESRWLAEFDAKGEVAAILESNVDLTDRKEAETRIRRLNETLEQRVDERTKELAVAEERFRGAFDVASIGMALVAPDGAGSGSTAPSAGWSGIPRTSCWG